MKKIRFFFRTLVVAFCLLFASFFLPVHSMDLIDKLKTPTGSVLTKAMIETIELEDFSQIVPGPVTLPPEVWLLIVPSVTELRGRVSLSMVSNAFSVLMKAIKQFPNEAELFRIVMLIQKQCLSRPEIFENFTNSSQLNLNRRLFLAGSITNEIKEIAAFSQEIDGLTERLQERQDISEHHLSILEGVNGLLEETNKDINTVSQDILHRSINNPKCFDCCGFEEEEYLFNRIQIANRNKIYNCCRFITRNLILNATITATLLGSVIFGGYFWFPDPVRSPYNITAWNEFGFCDSWAYEDCLPGGGYWGQNAMYLAGKSGPGYSYYTLSPINSCSYSNVSYVSGNLSDYIRYVSYQCGCNVTYWYNAALSLMNGTVYDPAQAICVPSPDNASVCCGRMWGNDRKNGWTCEVGIGDVCLEMIKITRRPTIIQRGLYYGFLVPVSFMFVWAAVIDYIWCSG